MGQDPLALRYLFYEILNFYDYRTSICKNLKIPINIALFLVKHKITINYLERFLILSKFEVEILYIFNPQLFSL